MSVTSRFSVTLALALLASTGCSLGLRGPGRTAYTATGTPIEPDCSESNVAPTLDLVAGVGLMVLGGMMMSCEPENTGEPVGTIFSAGVCAGAMTIGVPVLIGGAVQGGIGLHGYSKTGTCRTAKQKHHKRMARIDEQRQLAGPGAAVELVPPVPEPGAGDQNEPPGP